MEKIPFDQLKVGMELHSETAEFEPPWTVVIEIGEHRAKLKWIIQRQPENCTDPDPDGEEFWIERRVEGTNWVAAIPELHHSPLARALANQPADKVDELLDDLRGIVEYVNRYLKSIKRSICRRDD